MLNQIDQTKIQGVRLMSEKLLHEVHRHHVLRTLTKLVSVTIGAQNVVVTNRVCTHGHDVLASTANTIEFSLDDSKYTLDLDFAYLDKDNNEDHRLFKVVIHTTPGQRIEKQILEMNLFSEKSEYTEFSQWFKESLIKYASKVAA